MRRRRDGRRARRAAGRQDAGDRGRRGTVVDAGPTVFTMRWVFDEIFADAGTSLDERGDAAAARRPGAARMGRRTRLDLYADAARSADAIGALRGPRARRAASSRSAPAPRASTRRSSSRSCARRAAARWTSCAAPALRGLPDLVAHRAVRDAVARARRALPRSAPAATVRPLRDLLRLVAVPAAPATLMLIAHVEQDGVWTDRRRHAPHRRGAGRVASARGACVSLSATAVAEVLVDHGRAAGVRLANGERVGSRRGRRQRRRRGGRARACLGVRSRAVPRRRRAASRSLSAITWTLSATTVGISAAAPQRVLRRRLRRGVRRISSAARQLPRAPTVYVCAQDRDDGNDARHRVPANACCASSTHRRPATPVAFPPTEIDAMRGTDLSRCWRCGLDDPAQPERARC